VGASIIPGSDVTITNVGINPTRTGVLDVLTDMGADIQLHNAREQAGEPVADLRIRASRLHGLRIGRERIPHTIDEFPILCVAAAMAEGQTVISGAEELRYKESDRIATMATELKKMGVSIEETPDGLVIHGTAGRTLRGASCTSYGDHRVAMSLAMAGLMADAPTRIDNTDCIETSFPGFNAKRLELLT
jgi:3-phosphoshikimate 1-carboxyvinyltransferase